MGSPVLRIPTFFSTVRSVCVAASDNVLATLRRSSPTSSGAILFFTMSLQQSHKINDCSHVLLLQFLAMMLTPNCLETAKQSDRHLYQTLA